MLKSFICLMAIFLISLSAVAGPGFVCPPDAICVQPPPTPLICPNTCDPRNTIPSSSIDRRCPALICAAPTSPQPNPPYAPWIPIAERPVLRQEPSSMEVFAGDWNKGNDDKLESKFEETQHSSDEVESSRMELPTGLSMVESGPEDTIVISGISKVKGPWCFFLTAKVENGQTYQKSFCYSGNDTKNSNAAAPAYPR